PALPPRRDGHHERVDPLRLARGLRGHREDRPTAGGQERLRPVAADPRAGTGGQQDRDRPARPRGHGRREVRAARPPRAPDAPPGAPDSSSSSEASGASAALRATAIPISEDDSAANTMRPVEVWSKFVTVTSASSPIRSAASSTTTIVPSSR